MALDKLVDSTQLNTDLTSIANAIRTKGGTSGLLAFPAEFISAIEAISGGGGVPGIAEAEAGIITVETDIATPANNATNLFPGLDLDFKPDFLWISMTRETWDGLAATAANNHIYWIVAVDAALAPVLRWGNTTSTINQETAFMYGGAAVYNASSSGNGQGVAAGSNVSNTRWALNDDGTLSYSRNGTGSNAQTAIYAGQYQYIAVKLNGGD